MFLYNFSSKKSNWLKSARSWARVSLGLWIKLVPHHPPLARAVLPRFWTWVGAQPNPCSWFPNPWYENGVHRNDWDNIWFGFRWRIHVRFPKIMVDHEFIYYHQHSNHPLNFWRGGSLHTQRLQQTTNLNFVVLVVGYGAKKRCGGAQFATFWLEWAWENEEYTTHGGFCMGGKWVLVCVGIEMMKIDVRSVLLL